MSGVYQFCLYLEVFLESSRCVCIEGYVCYLVNVYIVFKHITLQYNTGEPTGAFN